MSSSSYTTNLSLSQFASLDKPSWLQDYNSDMSKIDGACKNFTGTDGSSAGTAGFVPAPATTDADKFLKSDGTWAEAGGGSSITLYTTTGQNTDGAMTQKATTNMICKNGDMTKLNIAGTLTGQGNNTISIGSSSFTGASSSVALGNHAVITSGGTGSVLLGDESRTSYTYSVGLGAYSNPSQDGVVDVSAIDGSNNKYGYQGENDASRTQYRKITGVHSGEDEHDVAIMNQICPIVYRETTDPTSSTFGNIGDLYVKYQDNAGLSMILRGLFICVVSDTMNETYVWQPLITY